MNGGTRARRLAATVTVLVVALLAWSPAAGQEPAGKPLLSETIRAALEEGGAAAARARFDTIVPERMDDYRLDPLGLAELGTAYATRGDVEAAQVVLLMVTDLQMATLDPEARAALAGIDAMLARAEAEDEAARVEAAAAPPPAPVERGEPRDDLARFFGLYGDPADTSSSAWRMYVTARCGYLLVGGMWGDAAPWEMRSVGPTSFTLTYVDEYNSPNDVAFRTGPDGHASAMEHGFDFLKTPLPRVGDLPEGWGEMECQVR
jgi:hypothetical protein